VLGMLGSMEPFTGLFTVMSLSCTATSRLIITGANARSKNCGTHYLCAMLVTSLDVL
jgi:hypothetical protein